MIKSKILAIWHILAAASLVFIALTIGVGELGHVGMTDWYKAFFTALIINVSCELVIAMVQKAASMKAAVRARLFAPDNYSVLHISRS